MPDHCPSLRAAPVRGRWRNRPVAASGELLRFRTSYVGNRTTRIQCTRPDAGIQPCRLRDGIGGRVDDGGSRSIRAG